MMLIDTHTHLYDEQFNDDRSAVIERAVSQGVSLMYLPNCDSGTIQPMLETESMFPDHCKAMMGLHPTYVKENWEEELDIIRSWLERRSFAAVGEIGLDYYWDKTFARQQQQAFRMQIEWSLEFKLPIVIHMREATRDTLDIVHEFAQRGVRGVFHCFSGSYEIAREIIDLGFYLGMGGVLTYPKAGLQEVIKQIDLKHLVLETDAPYLSPVPFRGKRNESAYVLNVAQKLAELTGTSIEEVASVTTANAGKLFGQ